MALLIVFQSHIGAIRIINNITRLQTYAKFQSHIGAIRMLLDDSYTKDNQKVFQSHIGAIRIS